MHHFRSVHDVTNVPDLLKLASACKLNPRANDNLGSGKRMGLIFLNPSMRTRLSTQIAARNLGIEPIIFDLGQEGWQLELEDGVVMNGTSVEHIRDAAPILGAYFDLIGIRCFPGLKDRDKDYSELLLDQLSKYAGVPIISLESTTLHPLQSLADLLTISETWKLDRKPKIVLAWAPHIKPLPQCVANSFAQWVCGWEDCDFTITHPPGYALDPQFTVNAHYEEDLQEALVGADYVYVKNWSSYEHYGNMPPVRGDWMLTQKRLQASNNARIMHCLPVRRNVELPDEILDSPSSLIQQQAENRVWAAQAVLTKILQENT